LGHLLEVNQRASRLLHEDVKQLESEIVSIVEHAREGQILLSFPSFGPITVATIIWQL